MRIESHPNRLWSAIDEAMEVLAQKINEEALDMIAIPFHWGKYGGGFGVTHRQGTGETVIGDFRNIIDFGNLALSQELRKTGFNTFTITWDGKGITPVIDVHDGTRKTPPRPWVTEIIWKRDWGQVLKEEIIKIL